MRVTVTVTADEMVVDWTGSDPTTKGPINLPFGMTVGLSSLVFKAVTTPDTPATGGNFRPLRVIAPAGTMMHATPPAPTFTLWPSLLGCDVMLKALALGMPDRVPARSGGYVSSMLGLGMNPRTGRQWHEGLNEGVGFGGHSGGDGENGIMHMAEPGCRNLPVEVIETKAPLFIERYGLRSDSGGPGTHRGGLGVTRTYRYLADSTVAMLVYKTRTRPWSIGGAGTGENAHIVMNPGTDAETTGGGFYRRIAKGEVLVNNSGGGGGWGDPFGRDPALVLADAREGYVTVEAARRSYGVVVDPLGLLVDDVATRLARSGPRPAPDEAVGSATIGPRPTVSKVDSENVTYEVVKRAADANDMTVEATLAMITRSGDKDGGDHPAEYPVGDSPA